MEIKDLLKCLDIQYNDLSLYEEAFTHRSFSNEVRHSDVDYERLEFMGDTVLEMLSSEFIFRTFQDIDEGEMTTLRAKAVREESLALYARELKLGDYIRLGNGEEKSGGRDRDSVLANVFESLLAAIYLDSGLDQAKKIMELVVYPRLAKKDYGHLTDYKTTLQELIQADSRESVVYELIEKIGPSNAPEFKVAVKMSGLTLGYGVGNSKKRAEQEAAKEALKKMASGKVDE